MIRHPKSVDNMREHNRLVGQIVLNWTLVEELSKKTLSAYISDDRNTGNFFTHNISSSQMGKYFKELVKSEPANSAAVNYVKQSFATNRDNRNRITHDVHIPEAEWDGVKLASKTTNHKSSVEFAPLSLDSLHRVVMDINNLKNALRAVYQWKTNNGDSFLLDMLGELPPPIRINPKKSHQK